MSLQNIIAITLIFEIEFWVYLFSSSHNVSYKYDRGAYKLPVEDPEETGLSIYHRVDIVAEPITSVNIHDADYFEKDHDENSRSYCVAV